MIYANLLLRHHTYYYVKHKNENNSKADDFFHKFEVPNFILIKNMIHLSRDLKITSARSFNKICK